MVTGLYDEHVPSMVSTRHIGTKCWSRKYVDVLLIQKAATGWGAAARIAQVQVGDPHLGTSTQSYGAQHATCQ